MTCYYLDFLVQLYPCFLDRARDYCTSGRHVVSMCINVIKVSVYIQVRI
jgi:hypothetical protein